jgi:LmbE family N-acetylglucosaminyl deacetylase
MNWQADPEKSRAAVLRLLDADPPDVSLRVAVLAAHPDDETIGASALLTRFPTTFVAYLTDGAPREKQLWPPTMQGSREEYAALRGQEAARALAHIGISDQQIFWLGGVDQEAIFEASVLVQRLAECLHQYRPNLLITHPYEGGHPDHDAAALIARQAVSALGRAPDFISQKICEMTSYHARYGRCVTGQFLNADPSSEIVLDLSDEDRQCKRLMMDEYKSQRLVLENFPIVGERLRIAPVYDFSRPPHEGKLWYECMGWPMTGARWRELAGPAQSNRSAHAINSA